MNLAIQPTPVASTIRELQTKSTSTSFSYDVLKTVVEKRWCKLRDKYVCLDGDQLRIYTRKSAKDYFESCPRIKIVRKETKKMKDGSETCTQNVSYKQFFPTWAADPQIRSVDDIYFDVSTKDSRPNCINLWKGFAIDQHTPDNRDVDITHLLDHIKLMCGGDSEQKAYEYFLDWLAHMFQKPYEKPQTYPIFGGKQGVGKTKIEELVTNMIGRCAVVKSTKFDLLFGKFNGGVSHKLLVVCNEGDSSASKQFAEVIKNFADAKVLNIQKKYQEAVSEESYHRLWMVTNHYNHFGVVAKGERRPFFMYASSEKLNESPQLQSQYFTKLAAMVDSKDVQWKFFKFLMARDLTRFNPRVAVKTNFHKEREKSSTPMLVRFLVGVLSDEDAPLKVRSNVMYKRYATWLSEQGQLYSRSNKAFTMELKSYNTDSGTTLVEFKKSGCMYMIFNKQALLQYIQQQYDYTGDDEDAIDVTHSRSKHQAELDDKDEEINRLKAELETKNKLIEQLQRKLSDRNRPRFKLVARLKQPNDSGFRSQDEKHVLA